MKTLNETIIYIAGCSTYMKKEYIDVMIKIACFIYDIEFEEFYY